MVIKSRKRRVILEWEDVDVETEIDPLTALL